MYVKPKLLIPSPNISSLITINLFLTSMSLFLFLINNLKMRNSVGFIACTMLYNYHIYLIPKHLLHPKETSYSLNCNSLFSTPLAPRNHYLLPVSRICLFWTFHIHGIIWYVCFCVWLLSVTVMFLRFIHFVACVDLQKKLLRKEVFMRFSLLIPIHLQFLF